jgi:hypothetical protein
MTFTLEDGEGTEVEIPARYEVCGTCEGKGTHVNPSIDSHGLTWDDFAEDPDFAEGYWEGRYDVPCNECGGRRVSPVVDESRATEAQQKMFNDWAESIAEMEAEMAAERRMGA